MTATARTALLVAFLLIPAIGTGKNLDYSIGLVTGELHPPDIRTLPQAAASFEDQHILVQFYGPLTDSDRRQLAADGIELLTYVPNYAYTAHVTGRPTRAVLDQYNVRWLGSIDPAYKISPSITDQGIREYSRRGEGRVEFIVQLHPDEDVSYWADWFTRELDAKIVGTVPFAQVVEIIVDEPMYFRISDLDAVIWIDQAAPEPIELNNIARVNTGAEYLQQAPFGLTGTGITVAQWDAGRADASHDDLGQYRVSNGDSSPLSTHATHVAGTVLGSGIQSDGKYRGMAPEASLVTQLWWGSTSEMATEYYQAIDWHDATISTNSWGYGVGDPASQSACENTLGNYLVQCHTLDDIVRGSAGAPITICWSAGNQRSSSSDQCGSLGWTFNTVGALASAKNVIAVGAIMSSTNAMTSFSSWGPTDDGRIKPDVVGPGCALTSCKLNTGYTTMCGTSMSCPAVAGTVALLEQQWQNEIGRGILLPSTIKAILINTATDLGATGPDYAYGHGKVNGVAAATKIGIGDPSYVQDSISTGEMDTYDLTVPGSAERVKVTLVWDDPGALANSNPALINDLDLVVVDPFGVETYPWKLNPTSPGSSAGRGEDHLNNVETVEIMSPVAGLYTARVTGYNIPEGPQQYSLVITPDSANRPGNTVAVGAQTGGDTLADPGTTAEIRFWALNAGTSLDSLHVQITDDLGWLQATVDTVVTLSPYDSAMFTLLVDVPSTALADDESVTSCSVISLSDPTVHDANIATVVAGAVYQIGLGAMPDDTVSSPETYDFEVKVYNQGNDQDVITVTPSIDKAWTISPEFSGRSVGIGDSATVSFTVNIPAEVANLETAQLTLAGSSGGGASDTVELTLVVDNPVFPPTLVSPDTVFYTQQRVLSFEWQDEGTATYSLFIAYDTNFTSLARTYTGIAATSYDMPAADSLGDNTYYWGVRKYADGDSSSLQLVPGQIIVDNIPPVQVELESPVGGAYVRDKLFTLEYSPIGGGGTVGAPENTVIEIASDSEFTSNLLEYDSVTTLSFQVSDTIAEGRWYWRVKRFDLAGNSNGFTGPATFVLDTEPPPVPTLVQPTPNQLLNGDTVYFVWSTDEPAAHEEAPEYYYLHVSNRADFLDFTTFQGYLHDTTKMLTSDQLELGNTYYWRVKPFDSASHLNDYSPASTFRYLSFVCGDFDGSDGTPDIGDLTAMVAYLYLGGDPPNPIESGSIDCNDIIDIGDVTYLITYLYLEGSEPCCVIE